MSRVLLGAYAVVSLVHLVVRIADGPARPGSAAIVTVALAMPLLAAHLWSSVPQSRLVVASLAALGFSWIGDVVPLFLDGDAAFLTLVGSFMAAQASYVWAFVPYWRDGLPARRRALLVPYLAVFAGLLTACLPASGALAPAVIVYGCLLMTMALLSTGVDVRAWIGGAVFLVSDGLIALDHFATALPAAVQPFAVMSTYLLAQALLIRGVIVRSVAAGEPAAGSGNRAR